VRLIRAGAGGTTRAQRARRLRGGSVRGRGGLSRRSSAVI
jgi:hypothetical protein